MKRDARFMACVAECILTTACKISSGDDKNAVKFCDIPPDQRELRLPKDTRYACTLTMPNAFYFSVEKFNKAAAGFDKVYSKGYLLNRYIFLLNTILCLCLIFIQKIFNKVYIELRKYISRNKIINKVY